MSCFAFTFFIMAVFDFKWHISLLHIYLVFLFGIILCLYWMLQSAIFLNFYLVTGGCIFLICECGSFTSGVICGLNLECWVVLHIFTNCWKSLSVKSNMWLMSYSCFAFEVNVFKFVCAGINFECWVVFYNISAELLEKVVS